MERHRKGGHVKTEAEIAMLPPAKKPGAGRAKGRFSAGASGGSTVLRAS